MASWLSRWSGTEKPRFVTATAPIPHYLADDRVVDVESAFVTPWAMGPLHTKDAPKLWSHGAVYRADGTLIPESQRYGGLTGDHVTAADPPTVTVTAASELNGTWLYGGHWMAHFGHFLTETLTNLWPADRAVDGLLCHPFVFGRTTPDAAELELAALAGYPQPVTIVAEPVRVERLLVPTRPYTTNGAATPRAKLVWDRVADAVGAPGRKASGRQGVFFSRSAFHAAHHNRSGRPHARVLHNEQQLDELFVRRGFRVVHPQDLSVREQIQAARASSTLVAVSGSALHLSAFARPGARVVEIGDHRSPDGLPNQRVVDAAAGHLAAVIPYLDPAPEPGQAPVIDLDHLAAILDRLGV